MAATEDSIKNFLIENPQSTPNEILENFTQRYNLKEKGYLLPLIAAYSFVLSMRDLTGNSNPRKSHFNQHRMTVQYSQSSFIEDIEKVDFTAISPQKSPDTLQSLYAIQGKMIHKVIIACNNNPHVTNPENWIDALQAIYTSSLELLPTRISPTSQPSSSTSGTPKRSDSIVGSLSRSFSGVLNLRTKTPSPPAEINWKEEYFALAQAYNELYKELRNTKKLPKEIVGNNSENTWVRAEPSAPSFKKH